jgi:hypothetical protein
MSDLRSKMKSNVLLSPPIPWDLRGILPVCKTLKYPEIGPQNGRILPTFGHENCVLAGPLLHADS